MYKLCVVATVVCLFFLSSLVLLPFANADWPMFRSDTSHSGAGTSDPVLTPTLLWNYTTGEMGASSPAVVGGVVYVSSEGGAIKFDGNVYALNASNGAKLWSYTNALVYSSPAVVNGVVYIGSYDGNVYALNATNGAKLWNYTTGSYVESSPAVAGA